MSARYVRSYYRVPARVGMIVTIDGRRARIVGFDGARLKVCLHGQPGVYWAHPTWNVVYPIGAAA